MSLTAIVEALVDAGATPQMILAAVRASESNAISDLDRRRAKDAARQQRKRDRNNVTSRDGHVTERDPLPLVPSPEPLSQTSTSAPPPISPPSAKPADEIWALQPIKFRRSTRPDVRKAYSTAARSAPPAEILAACQAYYRRPDKREDEGRYAKGAVWLLTQDRWRDFLPSLEPPATPPTAAMLAGRHQHFRDTGEWRPEWGNREQAA